MLWYLECNFYCNYMIIIFLKQIHACTIKWFVAPDVKSLHVKFAKSCSGKSSSKLTADGDIIKAQGFHRIVFISKETFWGNESFPRRAFCLWTSLAPVVHSTCLLDAVAEQNNCAPKFEEVNGAYLFQVVRASVRLSRTVHARVLKFYIWVPHEKNCWTFFFLIRVISLSGARPLWKNQNEIWCVLYLMNRAC